MKESLRRLLKPLGLAPRRRWPFLVADPPDTMPNKVDIVQCLADRYGYRHYLEIVTPTTGLVYGDIERQHFDDCRRLMYHCPSEFSDGLPIDYRCPDFDISTALSTIAAEERRFDIILVDGFHTYDVASRDLAAAFALLAPGGALVVHDCRPANAVMATPTFIPGGWCGVTYRAFLDFVLDRTDLRYLTVDTDLGCGVIRKLSRLAPRRRRALVDWRQQRKIAAWRRVGDDNDAAWRCFDANHRALLQLVSVGTFFGGRQRLD